MRELKKEQEILQWDCASFPCADDCCQNGVDVLAHERDSLIYAGMALPSDFIGPNADEDGVIVYRTQKGGRGCVFLLNVRGCKLHLYGHKPLVCREWPRTFLEAKQAAHDGDLPCFSLRYNKE
jgi:Fe-S-cluster containining protein